jgi:hypothetical protein
MKEATGRRMMAARVGAALVIALGAGLLALDR